MTLIDSNVLLDIFTADANWLDWSLSQVEKAVLRGPVIINDVIYAEASSRYATVDQYEAALNGLGVSMTPIPREALFLAGKAYLRYRRSGGLRTNVLSDFFIGAHAAVERLPLLTRDVGCYRSYFPTVELITP